MQIPGANEKARNSSNFVAAEDAGALPRKPAALLDRAVGVDWYRQHGTDVDRAALTLCRLRRARAGERGGPEKGDDAVRAVLGGREPAGRPLAREPRDLVHGRERLPGGRRAVVPDDARPVEPTLLAIAAPEERARTATSAAAARYGARATFPASLPRRRSARSEQLREPCASRRRAGPPSRRPAASTPRAGRGSRARTGRRRTAARGRRA